MPQYIYIYQLIHNEFSWFVVSVFIVSSSLVANTTFLAGGITSGLGGIITLERDLKLFYGSEVRC